MENRLRGETHRDSNLVCSPCALRRARKMRAPASRSARVAASNAACDKTTFQRVARAPRCIRTPSRVMLCNSFGDLAYKLASYLHTEDERAKRSRRKREREKRKGHTERERVDLSDSYSERKDMASSPILVCVARNRFIVKVLFSSSAFFLLPLPARLRFSILRAESLYVRFCRYLAVVRLAVKPGERSRGLVT